MSKEEETSKNETEAMFVNSPHPFEPPNMSMGKQKIIKNLLFLSFAHCLVFTAFDSLSNLQSTVNSEDSIGMISQAVIYAFFTVSSFFLPTYVIKKFGCKTTLVLSVFCICPYVVANLYPLWITLIPSAAICGIAFGPLWAARSTYVNEISHWYSTYTTNSVSVVNAWFFGIYSFFHENAEIWGNVISYFVLRPSTSNDTAILQWNGTLQQCGASFCDEELQHTNPNLEPPPETQRYTLIFIYLSLVAVAGILIKLIVDPLASKTKSRKGIESEDPTTFSLLIATFKHLRHRNQLLLLPLSFYCGIADGFYNSDFTKSYIACSSGISQVGFVTISYGVVCAAMDCSSGFLVKYLTRGPVFLIGALSHFAVLVTCLLWVPTPDSTITFFVLSGVYGLGSSVWWSQISAFYGTIFKKDEEAAFSNFYFWSSLGLLLAYAYSTHVCTYVKIYLLIVLLILGIASYFVVEIRTSYHTRKEITDSLNYTKAQSSFNTNPS